MLSWPKPNPATHAFSARFAMRHLLYKILRRWHCRCTHHWFAMDALPLVRTPAGHRLVSILLRNYDRYLLGTIDPDIRFRDFQNHVIHVRQGYWGGAPRVAHHWYECLLQNLREEKYGDAAHAAGVLSHYFVDPLQPLHTIQCARGRVIHRPLEWSVCQAYDEILRLWIKKDLRIVIQLSRGPGWLGEAILHGARYASHQYDQLIQEYDLDAAAEYPPDGLSDRLRLTLAGLFGLSITGWARVLERAAQESESLRRKPLPNAYVASSCVTAALRIPLQAWLHRLEHQLERDEIEQLIEEYREIGRLKLHLPAEVDIMHRVAKIYADELRYQEEKRRERLTRQSGLAQGRTPLSEQSDRRAA